jgi:DnaJ-class molecular chaperone
MQDIQGQSASVLETRCDRCEGRGGRTERREWVSCFWCKGAGYLPTEEGKRILALMRHNFQTMLDEGEDRG